MAPDGVEVEVAAATHPAADRELGVGAAELEGLDVEPPAVEAERHRGGVLDPEVADRGGEPGQVDPSAGGPRLRQLAAGRGLPLDRGTEAAGGPPGQSRAASSIFRSTRAW